MTRVLTQVDFHTGVPDALAYAYRLLRKAVNQGAKVTVVAPAEQIKALDLQLWANEPASFIPHVCVGDFEKEMPDHVQMAAIWLVSEAQAQGWERPVLLNLGATIPSCAQACSRLIEVVSHDDAHKQQAKQRWRTYQSWGLQPVHHPYLTT